MAVDAGTGSCRAVIFDLDGNQTGFSQHEWTHKTLPGYPGSQVFDTKTNWELIRLCIRNSMEKAAVSPSQIKAVSATSMREGMVLYDEDGKEIWACPNVDSRAPDESVELIKSGAAQKIYFTSGDWISITSPPRFLWIKKHEPEIFHDIAHMGMLADWIIYRLSQEFVTDPSIGSSSGMFDIKKREWSRDIISLLGLDEGIFPRVVHSGYVVGQVAKKAAEDTGLAEGTPVVVGGADTQLGLLGIGVSEPEQPAVLGGTFWQTTVLFERPIIDPEIRLRTLCGTVNGQWMLEGIGFYCGLSMRWFRDAFCEKEKEKAEILGVDAYELMEKEASKVPPGSNGVIGIFSNLMNSRRWVHAAPGLLQYNIASPETSGKKESIRAIEEAAAYVSLGHMKIIESLIGQKTDKITFAGGGSKGFLWPQVLADVTGVRVDIPFVKESTALGAAICAGVGAGFYNSLRDGAERIARIEKSLEPNHDNHEIYSKLYEKWLDIYCDNLKMVEDGTLHPMWRAAGT